MKIIHCADLHLDSALRTHFSKERARERGREILHTFQRMTAYAGANGVEAVILAGDVFDRKTVSVKARNVFLDEIKAHPGIDFYYLKGNHDEGGFFDAEGEKPENLILFSDEWRYYERGNGAKRVCIAGTELNSENGQRVYDSLSLDPSCYNIVILHGQESEYRARDRAQVVRLDALRGRGIDYLALGHVHTYKKERLDARGVYCYAGCLEGRGFDECGEHGFVLLEIDEETGKGVSGLVPFAERRLFEALTDITGCRTSGEIAEQVKKALEEGAYRPQDLVRVVLTGEVAFDCERDPELIARRFEEEFYYFEVRDRSGLKVDYDSYANDRSLKGEFIRMVKRDDTLSDEDRAAIIRYGMQALKGEEIH